MIEWQLALAGLTAGGVDVGHPAALGGSQCQYHRLSRLGRTFFLRRASRSIARRRCGGLGPHLRGDLFERAEAIGRAKQEVTYPPCAFGSQVGHDVNEDETAGSPIRSTITSRSATMTSVLWLQSGPRLSPSQRASTDSARQPWRASRSRVGARCVHETRDASLVRGVVPLRRPVTGGSSPSSFRLGRDPDARSQTTSRSGELSCVWVWAASSAGPGAPGGDLGDEDFCPALE